MKKITYLLLLIFSLASTNISYRNAISANISGSSDSNLMGKALTLLIQKLIWSLILSHLLQEKKLIQD